MLLLGTKLIRKIISNGHTGAEQAALDVAIKLGIPFGGWAIEHRNAEDGSVLEKYPLEALNTDAGVDDMEKNVLESQATLIISRGELTGKPASARKIAMKNLRHWLHLDMNTTPHVQAVSIISSWIRLNQIEVLHVTGPQTREDPRIYQEAMHLLAKAICVILIKDNIDEFFHLRTAHSRIVDVVTRQIDSNLSLKQKVFIANLGADEIETMQYAIDLYVCCRPEVADARGLFDKRAYTIIMKTLWDELKETHRLHLVK